MIFSSKDDVRYRRDIWLVIIEGAFLKLPEVLLESSFPREVYEGTLVNLLAMCVLLELNARNIATPVRRIRLQCPYSGLESVQIRHADLYVDLSGVSGFRGDLFLYGITGNNWIEAKFFAGQIRHESNEDKTTNAGRLAFDLFRLCAFLNEPSDLSFHVGRYLLNVFTDDPSVYMAFNRRNGSRRTWLEQLLKPGTNSLQMVLDDEPPSFRKVFGDAFETDTRGLNLSARVTTLNFGPAVKAQELETGIHYWGFLSRVTDFDLGFAGKDVSFKDSVRNNWNPEKAKALRDIAVEAVGLTPKEDEG